MLDYSAKMNNYQDEGAQGEYGAPGRNEPAMMGSGLGSRSLKVGGQKSIGRPKQL